MINSRLTTIVTKLNEVYPIQQKDVACGCRNVYEFSASVIKGIQSSQEFECQTICSIETFDRTVHQNIFIQISNRIIECLTVSYVKYVRKYL
jgi:hypothetical protein